MLFHWLQFKLFYFHQPQVNYYNLCILRIRGKILKLAVHLFGCTNSKGFFSSVTFCQYAMSVTQQSRYFSTGNA